MKFRYPVARPPCEKYYNGERIGDRARVEKVSAARRQALARTNKACVGENDGTGLIDLIIR